MADLLQLRRGFAAALIIAPCLWFSMAIPLSAQTPPAYTELPVAIPRPTDYTVLLRNGGMVRGKVVVTRDAYVVTPEEGRHITVSRADVASICESDHHAFMFLAKQIPSEDTDGRLRLVEWAIAQSLLDDAEQELGSVAKISKRKTEIESLYARIGLKRRPSTVGETTPVKPVRRKPSMQIVSPKALAEYTKQIQPILINGCATASCHGQRATAEFQLFKPSRGFNTSKRLTQRNLNATLQQIDMVDPSASSLLLMGGKSHGGRRAITTREADSFKKVTAWIEMVAGPIAPPQAQPATDIETLRESIQSSNAGLASAQLNGTGVKTNSMRGIDSEIHSSRGAANWAEPNVTQQATQQRTQLPPLDPGDGKAGRLNGRDPFDPDVFNKQYGSNR